MNFKSKTDKYVYLKIENKTKLQTMELLLVCGTAIRSETLILRDSICIVNVAFNLFKRRLLELIVFNWKKSVTLTHIIKHWICSWKLFLDSLFTDTEFKFDCTKQRIH